MPTSFPTGLDTFTNPAATDPLNTPSHSGQHSDENDAIEAIEAKVGVDGSAVTTTIDHILKNTTTGHDHDGTDSKRVTHADLSGLTANNHHNQSHVLATGTALGADHTISGAAAGEVLRALSATTAAFDAIVDGDLPASIMRDSEHTVASHNAGGAADLTTIYARLAVANTFTALQTISGFAGPVLDLRPSAATQDAFQIRAVGNANPRFAILGDGTINWGAAGTAADVTLYRDAANSLTLEDKFRIVRALSTDEGMNTLIAGEGFARMKITANGTLEWGGGAATPDVDLFRDAANVLKTNDKLIVGGALDATGLLHALGAVDVDGAFHALGSVEIDGALNHDGTTVGFYNVAPVTRPAAYTQTFATATRTHAARAAGAITNDIGLAQDLTIEDMPALQTVPAGMVSGERTAIRNNFSDIAEQLIDLRTDSNNTAQVVNQMLDDLQSQGLLQ